MKNAIILILAAFMFATCKTTPDSDTHNASVKELTGQSNDVNLHKIFLDRQQRLLKKIGNGIVFIRSDYGFTGGRNEYRAANNFYYLTGFKQPNSMIVLNAKGLNPYTLLIQKKTIEEAIYTGEMPGEIEITKRFGPDTVLPLEESDRIIELSIKTRIPIYIDYSDVRFKSYIGEMIRNAKGDDNLMLNIAPLVQEMRVIKDSLEIAEMGKAVNITGEAFTNACRICIAQMFENEIEAMIEFTFRKEGSSMPAFQSIVGSGPNTVKLHYSENNRQMEQGDLLLMDIGAEYNFYCGDITRTIPVNGIFSKDQRTLYDLVLRSQKAAIAEMRPGKTVVEGHNASTRILVRGLFEIGLITDTTCNWQKKFYILYPISHYLGMDVHDVGDYGTDYPELMENIANDTIYGRKLEPGMVLTVEPGLYIRSNGLDQLSELFGNEATSEEIRSFTNKVASVYKRYENIGIRIEDDVLIVNNGCENLSAGVPKEIDQIEKLMQKRNRLDISF